MILLDLFLLCLLSYFVDFLRLLVFFLPFFDNLCNLRNFKSAICTISVVLCVCPIKVQAIFVSTKASSLLCTLPILDTRSYNLVAKTCFILCSLLFTKSRSEEFVLLSEVIDYLLLFYLSIVLLLLLIHS